MKKTILFLWGMFLGIVLWWAIVYLYLSYLFQKDEDVKPEISKNISPNYVEIDVKDTMYMNEFVDLNITMMKNWERLNNYTWAIEIKIIDENWNELTPNECTLPNSWFYKFKESNLWSIEFQRWLSIKKDGTFYIEVSNIFDEEWAKLWMEKINVVNL